MDPQPENKPVVIPQDYVDQIIYLEETITDSKFAIGDILVYLVDLYDGRKREVCEYLQGTTALEWKTLSDYETTARRWPPDLRQQYASMPFSVFRNLDPANKEDMELIDKAVDNQLTANKVLDLKYDRGSPGYVIRNCIRMLSKLDLDPELEEIVDKLSLKLMEYDLEKMAQEALASAQ